jgi:hypothetical protein
MERGFTEFVSKFKRVVKRESSDGQMVTDLITVRNMIRGISRWPQMTKW